MSKELRFSRQFFKGMRNSWITERTGREFSPQLTWRPGTATHEADLFVGRFQLSYLSKKQECAVEIYLKPVLFERGNRDWMVRKPSAIRFQGSAEWQKRSVAQAFSDQLEAGSILKDSGKNRLF